MSGAFFSVAGLACILAAVAFRALPRALSAGARPRVPGLRVALICLAIAAMSLTAVASHPVAKVGLFVDGGVVVTYGSMSGEDPVMSRAALGRGVRLVSFNLGNGLAKRSPEQVRAIYADLAVKLRDGVLKAPIDAAYPIEDIKQALAHAQRGGRNGKVLVLPNGPLDAS